MKLLLTSFSVHLLFFLSSCSSDNDSSHAEKPHSPENFEEVDQARFNEISKSSDKIIALKIYSNRCHYCQGFAPILSKVASKHPEMTFIKTEVPKNKSWAQTEARIGTPTVKYFYKGKLLGLIVGKASASEIEEMITAVKKRATKMK